MYSAQGIFQHHFQCKKVCTILDKILYLVHRTSENSKSHIWTTHCCQKRVCWTLSCIFVFMKKWFHHFFSIFLILTNVIFGGGCACTATRNIWPKVLMNLLQHLTAFDPTHFMKTKIWKIFLLLEISGKTVTCGLYYKNILTIVSDDRKWSLYYSTGVIIT